MRVQTDAIHIVLSEGATRNEIAAEARRDERCYFLVHLLRTQNNYLKTFRIIT